MKTLTDWGNIKSLNLNSHIGFTYSATNLQNNKIYIGSKFIINSRTKRLNPDWRYYKTSRRK